MPGKHVVHDWRRSKKDLNFFVECDISGNDQRMSLFGFLPNLYITQMELVDLAISSIARSGDHNVKLGAILAEQYCVDLAWLSEQQLGIEEREKPFYIIEDYYNFYMERLNQLYIRRIADFINEASLLQYDELYEKIIEIDFKLQNELSVNGHTKLVLFLHKRLSKLLQLLEKKRNIGGSFDKTMQEPDMEKLPTEYSPDQLLEIYRGLVKMKITQIKDLTAFLSFFTVNPKGKVQWDPTVWGAKAGLFDLMERLTGVSMDVTTIKRYCMSKNSTDPIHNNWKDKEGKPGTLIDKIMIRI